MRARAFFLTVLVLLVALPLFAKKTRTADDPREPAALVLCYHIVESPQDSRMEVSRETFRQHMRYLAMTGYNVIPLRHLYEFVAGKRKSLPKNAIVITIDDGWRSTYTEAFPELKKRGFPFTVFIYPKIIGRTTIALNWDQIREMAKSGGDIQSHTLSHAFLTRRRQRSLDEKQYEEWLHKELVESKRRIEKETGTPVRYLAYPYGDYDARVAATVAKSGYDAALTCDYGYVRKGSDPMRMKRVIIDKRMDFAAFRQYLGARSFKVDAITPSPGDIADTGQPLSISARIPNPESVEPGSVGMALLSLGNTAPYKYDRETGAVSLMLGEPLPKGKYHRAVVWATEAKTGRRVEYTWAFRLPEPAPATPPPSAVPPATAPAVATEPARGLETAPEESRAGGATNKASLLAPLLELQRSVTRALTPKK